MKPYIVAIRPKTIIIIPVPSKNVDSSISKFLKFSNILKINNIKPPIILINPAYIISILMNNG